MIARCLTSNSTVVTALKPAARMAACTYGGEKGLGFSTRCSTRAVHIPLKDETRVQQLLFCWQTSGAIIERIWLNCPGPPHLHVHAEVLVGPWLGGLHLQRRAGHNGTVMGDDLLLLMAECRRYQGPWHVPRWRVPEAGSGWSWT